MTNVFEVDSAALIQKAAGKLKEAGVAKPAYIEFVKTGPAKERVPQSRDFWYVRCASILRQVYIAGPVGVSRLRSRYGAKKGHVVSRHHHMRAGGSHIKDAFDALEKLGYVKKGKKGRELTAKGRAFLDRTAKEVAGSGA